MTVWPNRTGKHREPGPSPGSKAPNYLMTVKEVKEEWGKKVEYSCRLLIMYDMPWWIVTFISFTVGSFVRSKVHRQNHYLAPGHIELAFRSFGCGSCCPRRMELVEQTPTTYTRLCLFLLLKPLKNLVGTDRVEQTDVEKELLYIGVSLYGQVLPRTTSSTVTNGGPVG